MLARPREKRDNSLSYRLQHCCRYGAAVIIRSKCLKTRLPLIFGENNNFELLSLCQHISAVVIERRLTELITIFTTAVKTLSVRMSVCLTRVLCNKKKEPNAYILTQCKKKSRSLASITTCEFSQSLRGNIH